jgi:hypothetical protein
MTAAAERAVISPQPMASAGSGLARRCSASWFERQFAIKRSTPGSRRLPCSRAYQRALSRQPGDPWRGCRSSRRAGRVHRRQFIAGLGAPADRRTRLPPALPREALALVRRPRAIAARRPRPHARTLADERDGRREATSRSPTSGSSRDLAAAASRRVICNHPCLAPEHSRTIPPPRPMFVRSRVPGGHRPAHVRGETPQRIALSVMASPPVEPRAAADRAGAPALPRPLAVRALPRRARARRRAGRRAPRRAGPRHAQEIGAGRRWIGSLRSTRARCRACSRQHRHRADPRISDLGPRAGGAPDPALGQRARSTAS